jgi:hypothetical protein
MIARCKLANYIDNTHFYQQICWYLYRWMKKPYNHQPVMKIFLNWMYGTLCLLYCVNSTGKFNYPDGGHTSYPFLSYFWPLDNTTNLTDQINGSYFLTVTCTALSISIKSVWLVWYCFQKRWRGLVFLQIMKVMEWWINGGKNVIIDFGAQICKRKMWPYTFSKFAYAKASIEL